VVISQQHRSSPVQVQDGGIQRLKGGLDVGQPLAVLGGQAVLQPGGGRIAVCSVARRRLLVLDRRLLSLGTDPVEHRSDTGEHRRGVAAQLRSRRRSRRTSPPIRPSKADGRPAGCITVAGPQRVEVGQSAVGRSDGLAVPLVGDEGAGGTSQTRRASLLLTALHLRRTCLLPPVARPRQAGRHHLNQAAPAKPTGEEVPRITLLRLRRPGWRPPAPRLLQRPRNHRGTPVRNSAARRPCTGVGGGGDLAAWPGRGPPGWP
jgi:hypothetical protein